MRQGLTQCIDMDESDKAADHHFLFHFSLNESDHARPSHADHAALEADDLAEVDWTAEEHAVNLQADDVFGPGQAGGGDEARLDEPFSTAPGIQRAVMVEIAAHHHVMGNAGINIHASLFLSAIIA